MVEMTKEAETGAESVAWDLSPLYNSPDDPTIDVDMQKVAELINTFEDTYRGRIAELTPSEVVNMMQAQEAIADLQGRLYNYAALIHSTDTLEPTYGALVVRLQEFFAHVGQQMVFVELEWNDAPDDYVESILNAPEVAQYSHYLEADRRYKPYLLSEVEEQLLMQKSTTGANAWVRFFDQLMGIMRYEFDGEELTQTQVLSKQYDPDRDVRCRAADSLTEGLSSKVMELTYIFNTLVADKAIDDRLRDYPTWVSSRNLSNKAPDSVVESLIESVTSRYDIVAKHYNLKRILLGLDELAEYDRYAPLPVKESNRVYHWEETKDIVLSAFSNFHQKMAATAQRFFDGQWIHAKLLPNKIGGAYASAVVPSVHPYIFLNYTGTARDISTLAHELGHGIHMVLSGEEHGLFALHTPLTTAETASVFAEMLVFEDLMEKESDPEARLAMLVAKIEDTFATVFRQISMNRFEHSLHTARREQGELSTERISELWLESQRDMFQGSVTLRDNYGIWWSYIGHFLSTPGYVYAYSFGELLVFALYALYKEQGESFAPKYLEILAAGNSDYPDKILEKVGVDLNNPAFWNKGLDAIEALVVQEEALAREVYPEKFV